MVSGLFAGRYKIERMLGQGATATVHLARDTQRGTAVAIKILRPELAKSKATERFLKEIRRTSHLHHPHILQVLDSGEHEERPYFVLPYMEGGTLRLKLKRNSQLPFDETIAILRTIAAALDYAHSKGLIHRDVKPENILFTDGQACLGDFGIARALETAYGITDGTTSSDTIRGTYAYMSPEQAAGGKNLDGRSDIYSLACVAYEMITGMQAFIGPTPEAVVAQRFAYTPREVRAYRPSAPPAVDVALSKAFAMSPADRYKSATDFLSALEAASQSSMVQPKSRRLRPYISLAVLALLMGGVTARQLFHTSRELDVDRVLIYPLVERGLPPGDSGAGYDVALMLGAALEHTEPLKWLDGWEHLDVRERADPGLVTARTARRIAEDRGARYYLDGIVREISDSMSVTLRLHDVVGDSVVAQRTEVAAVGGSPPYQLGLAAVTQLLPRLLAADRRIDFTPLTDRRPGAVALWLQGEREYRLARFGPALKLYERAVAEDSALAFAAVKGAQAANWLQYLRQARQLLAVALLREAQLPPRYRDFARGLDAYFRGRADSAVFYLERARASAPAWEEAAMALGDVHYHLLPARTPHDSLARAAFEAAAETDTLFTPPLLHLIEIAARDGDVRRAKRLMQRLRAGQPDTTLLRQLDLMVSCIDETASRFNWAAAGSGNSVAMLFAAKGLAVAGAQPECAEAGFRAVLARPASSAGQRWSALIGLQGLLAGRGRISELVALLDSSAASGTYQAIWLYMLDSEAGLPVHRQAAQIEAMARERFGDKLEGASPHVLWMLALHYARLGNIAQVEALNATLASRVAEPGARASRLLSDAVAANLAVVKRDTATALSRLRALAATGTVDTLTWSLWEPLAVERLKLARFLMARGEFAEAASIASTFDHAQPIAFLPFVPASLEIRFAASRALGDAARASVFKRRLERLGRTDLTAVHANANTERR